MKLIDWLKRKTIDVNADVVVNPRLLASILYYKWGNRDYTIILDRGRRPIRLHLDFEHNNQYELIIPLEDHSPDSIKKSIKRYESDIKRYKKAWAK